MSTSTVQLFLSLIRNFRSSEMNRAMIGHTVEQGFPPVTREAIVEFARATRDDNPAYDGARPPAPPFFLGKLIIPLVKRIWAHPFLNLNLLRSVQISQSLTWLSPIRQGDEVTIHCRIQDISDTPRGQILELSGTASVEGRVVVQGKVGFLVKARNRGRADSPRETGSLPEIFRLHLPTVEGQQLLYARASGDNNFIHTNRFLARMAGLPRTVLHGACSLAMICNSLSKHFLDGDTTRLASVACRFGKPVFPGETLTILGYGSEDENTVPFAVFNSQGKAVFREGVLTHKR